MARLNSYATVKVSRFNPLAGLSVDLGNFSSSGTRMFDTGGLTHAVLLFDSLAGTIQSPDTITCPAAADPFYRLLVWAASLALPLELSSGALSVTLRITRQGLPAAKTPSGMSRVTTLPAPMIDARSNMDAGQDHRAAADPDVRADLDRPAEFLLPPQRGVERMQSA